MNANALLIFGDVLVVGLPVSSWLTRRHAGLPLVGERARWICYTIGCVALCLAAIASGFWFGLVTSGLGVACGVLQMWVHWDDDDDDWPGPRRLAEWAKRKLARRPAPVPAEVER